jgi:hypothetical protein
VGCQIDSQIGLGHRERHFSTVGDDQLLVVFLPEVFGIKETTGTNKKSDQRFLEVFN